MVRAMQVDGRWKIVGRATETANEYLVWLIGAGRSSYTQRSYALAVASFLRWLADADRSVESVDRTLIVAMLSEWAPTRSAATVNHRLAALGSFFGWLIDRDIDGGPWAARDNPVPVRDQRRTNHMVGRDAPPRERLDLRRRLPVLIPRTVTPADSERLLSVMSCLRDRALLLVLLRTGARIGDWIAVDDRHGVLGLAVDDVDATGGWIRVRLKGSRREHRVPLAPDACDAWRVYLSGERIGPDHGWAWSGRRRGAGRPLRYDAFASMLRSAAQRCGVVVHAHMFRHTLAQDLVDHGALHAAQAVLGHSSIATTADRYARTSEPLMVAAVADAATRARRRETARALNPGPTGWVFPYDESTIATLDALTERRS